MTRLIDADALLDKVAKGIRGTIMSIDYFKGIIFVVDCIDNAPTITDRLQNAQPAKFEDRGVEQGDFIPKAEQR